MYKILKRLDKKQIIYILIGVVLIVMQVYLDLKLPDYISKLTLIIKTPGSVTKDLFDPASKMLFVALLSFILAIITGYFLARVAISFSKKLRKDLFYKIEEFSLEEIKKFSISSLTVRSTNDVINLQNFLAMGLQVIIKAPILAVWAVSKIYTKNLTWSLITLGYLAVMLIIVIVALILIIPKTTIIQKLIDKLNNVSRENITGIRVIKAFNAENYQKDKFNEINEEVTSTNYFIALITSIFSPLFMFVMSSLTLIIYYTGANMIDKAIMADKLDIFSNMVVFGSYASQVISAFIMLVMIFIIYPRAKVSASRVSEVLDTDPSIISGKFKSKTDLTGTVEFKNVSFKYPDAEECILKDISFKANMGETIAFLGGTGSGKSTLINLIPRLYDVTKGEVLVNGINVKEYDKTFLNNIISYIPQKAVIFKGTIKSNIKFGKSTIQNNKVEEAVKVSQSKLFVNKLPKKLNYFVASRGTNLSGGQKQRLAIARGIAREPEIYIFDDSFSALDYKTDSKLREDLNKYTKNATKIIVAQRIGTIMNADLIIVLDEGKMVSSGTHKELMKTSPIYKEIALTQLSEEELS